MPVRARGQKDKRPLLEALGLDSKTYQVLVTLEKLPRSEPFLSKSGITRNKIQAMLNRHLIRPRGAALDLTAAGLALLEVINTMTSG